MPAPLFAEIARTLIARLNCIENKNGEWTARHEASLRSIANTFLPSGSGFDSKPQIDLEASKADRLVINGSFHEMNDAGYYNGWTDFQVVVTPSLAFGADIKVKGRMSADLREYIGEAYQCCLTTIPEADHFRKALAG